MARITLETINSIFGAVYPSKGFAHNSGNDAIIEKLDALNVTEEEVRAYTTTEEFMMHEQGYHALRGLYRYVRTLRKGTAAKKASGEPKKSRKASAPKASKAKKASGKAEPKPAPAPAPAPAGTQHKSFRKALNVLTIAKRPLLMVGPAGSGKSYTAASLARECGATAFYTRSKVVYETDLTGYMDSHNRYVSTSLYRAMKRANDGEKTAFFLDEIFAGDTNCLVIINDLLSDGKMEFPNGEVLSAENLLIMAADNTSGNGATNHYNTRNKADKSFLNRFGAVMFDYDKDVEKKLACDNKQILDFVRNIREAAERAEIDIICSYRTIESLKAYADAGIEPSEAIETFVYQEALTTDDKDTLRMDDRMARLMSKGNVYALAM